MKEENIIEAIIALAEAVEDGQWNGLRTQIIDILNQSDED